MTTSDPLNSKDTADSAPSNGGHRTDAELDALLANAEQEIRAFRAELAERQQAELQRVLEDLPQDLSAVQGKWSDLRKLLELMMREHRR